MNPLPEWIQADWPAPDGVVAGCTTRLGGVSTGSYASLNLGGHVGDNDACVAENRSRFLSACDLVSEPSWLNQIHGNRLAVDPPHGTCPEADAILSRQAGSTCAVLVADCLPVLFVSKDGRACAAAHAGWRGLAGGVLEATIAEFDESPSNLLAWLGPAISQQHFEVGDEVRQAFLQHDASADQCFVQNSRGRWQADLYALARLRLGRLGVQHVFGGGLCTFDDQARFFSYRRDGQCGRMASFVTCLPV